MTDERQIHPDLQVLWEKVIDDVVAAQPLTAWGGSPFGRIKKLEIDSRGKVAEHYLAALIRLAGFQCSDPDDTTDMEKGWDLLAFTEEPDPVELRIEIKGATWTTSSKAFQHEGIDRNRQWDGLVFVDVSPYSLYVNVFPKRWIDWSRLHQRKTASVYKWDGVLAPPGPGTKRVFVGHGSVCSVDDFHALWRQGLADMLAAKNGAPRPRSSGLLL